MVDTAQRTGAVVCVVTLGSEDQVLPRLAELTGGVFVKESSLDRVAARFSEILESFRNRYLVSFYPTGVEREGWHTLKVRVKGGGDVRARSGYWSGPAATPAHADAPDRAAAELWRAARCPIAPSVHRPGSRRRLGGASCSKRVTW